MQNSEASIVKVWDATAALGTARHFVQTFSVPCVLHDLPCSQALMDLCFLAGNAPLIQTRERGPISTSHGSIVVQLRKTGKSNFTDLTMDNAVRWEMEVNRDKYTEWKAQQRQLGKGSVKGQSSTQPEWSFCAYKSLTPEEMIAQCAVSTSRDWFAVMRGDAEFGAFAESTGMLTQSGGGAKKYERQGSVNELIDTGRVSKLHRDEKQNYGKDLLADFQREEQHGDIGTV